MLMNQEPLDLFIANLVKESGLNLPEDFKQQYIEKLKEQLNRRLGLVLIEDLDEAGLAEFSQLMGQEPQPDFQAIQNFYATKIPNFEQKIQSAMIEFANEFIATAKK